MTDRPSTMFPTERHEERLRRLEDRTLTLEHDNAAHKASLNAGMERFTRNDNEHATLARSIDERTKPPALRPWIPIALAIALPLAAWMHLTSSKPTNDEMSAAIEARAGTYVVDRQRILRVVDAYDRERAELQRSMTTIEKEQIRINEQLETLLDYLKKPVKKGR